MLQLPPKVIVCERHGRVPWSVVCDHLLFGKGHKTRHWHGLSVRDGREVETDWFCKYCYGLALSGQDAIPVTAVCMFCLRELRGDSGE